MQPGYLYYLDLFIDLQLSSLLKLPTLLVNLSFVTNNTNHFRRWLNLKVLRFAFTEKVVFKVINTRNNHMNSRGVHLSWQGTKHLANCRVLITAVPLAKMELSFFFILQHRKVIKSRNGTFVIIESLTLFVRFAWWQAIVRDMYLFLRSIYTECVLHYIWNAWMCLRMFFIAFPTVWEMNRLIILFL